MNTRMVLNRLGWILIATSALVLGAACFLESSISKALESALPAGILLALAGHLFTQSKSLSDAAEKRSLFNLEGFKNAFDHAQSLISDGNNDRAKWIEAARSLAHGEELAKAVTVDEHKLVLEVERLKYRGHFHQLLAERPSTFFYGVLPTYSTLDEAAKRSTAPETNGDRMTSSTVNELAEASIRAVWQAAQWPENYQDPLGEHFSDNDIGKMYLLFPNLHKHFEHRRKWHSASGKLYPRSQNTP